MAFSVIMQKVEETCSHAKYSYCGDGVNIGYVMLDKDTGEVTLVERAQDDDADNFSLRASWKLRKEWKDGRVPDRAHWAS
jgi:hypothetical protein